MIGIIGAMSAEISYFLEKMQDVTSEKYADREFFLGFLGSKEVVLVQAGIGKVNAALSTTLLIEKYHADYIINCGLAGGVNPCKQMDLVIASGLVYNDVSMPGSIYGKIDEMPLIFEADKDLFKCAVNVAKKKKKTFRTGLIASGDKFITDYNVLKEIVAEAPDIIATEMEGAAVAQVCFIYQIPFIVIRMISDVLNSLEQTTDYFEIKDTIGNACAKFIIDFIDEY